MRSSAKLRQRHAVLPPPYYIQAPLSLPKHAWRLVEGAHNVVHIELQPAGAPFASTSWSLWSLRQLPALRCIVQHAQVDWGRLLQVQLLANRCEACPRLLRQGVGACC